MSVIDSFVVSASPRSVTISVANAFPANVNLIAMTPSQAQEFARKVLLGLGIRLTISNTDTRPRPSHEENPDDRQGQEGLQGEVQEG